MISSNEIHKKATNQYFRFIETRFNKTSFFPLDIPANKQAIGNFANLQNEINDLLKNSKQNKNFGYNIELNQVNTKKYGIQSLPSRIWFETQIDFLKFIDKQNEFEKLQKNIEIIESRILQLTNWSINSYKKVIKYQDVWNEILLVCKYFLENPKPNLYIRELPITLETKFVENHKPIISELLEILIPEYINSNESLFEKRFNLKYAEPLVRFLILDEEIASQFFNGLKDISIPTKDFTSLQLPVKRCIIIENKTTIYPFLTLPPLKNTIAIYGGGYNVATQKNINWLNETDILYWGDIDAQGFEILSQVRTYYPHTKSILMDIETLSTFNNYAVEGTLSNIKATLNLTQTEYKVYNQIKAMNIRLEQEKIHFEFVNKLIKEKCS
jgi:hypothetical protein